MKKIALIGDYSPDFAPHRFTEEACNHSLKAMGLDLAPSWIPTLGLDQAFSPDAREFRGLWIAPGSPYKDMAATLRAIRFARERRIPLLGTCGGFQHLVLEFARNVAGLEDTAHAEYDPEASRIVIMKLACSLVGKTLPIQVRPGSLAHRAYGKERVNERFYCQFGLNPEFIPALTGAGLAASGADDTGEARILELPGHPFFLGTLYVPQALSTPEAPHPIVSAFLAAAAEDR